MPKTMELRFVEKPVSAGGEYRIGRVLQQWYEAEGWEHKDIVAQGGYWEDVPFVLVADKEFPA
jgi:hypothetical protein